ncbi:hypothetical protein RHS01_01632 [Rhizoctonia solani]|uniref:Uncharacterized protein n=1 Tax=Rhizoctonia solani TaxID=456999 RepID=A0A8H7IK24_9AGAM|nr:hypothetical protein RHS01_01632 [Rhizoctonia solani]
MSSIFALALFAQVIVANPVYRRQDITTTATNATATPTIDPTLSDNVTSTATDSITLTSEPTPTTDTFTVPITSTISTPSPTGGSEDDGSYWFCSFPGAEATPTPTWTQLPSDTLSSTDTLTLSIPTDTETNIPTATDTSTFPEVTDTDLPTFSDTEIPTATETATSTDVSTSVEATSTALPTATESSTLPEITSIAWRQTVLLRLSLYCNSLRASPNHQRSNRELLLRLVLLEFKLTPSLALPPPQSSLAFASRARNATDAAPASTLSENTAIPTTTFGVVG